MDQYADIHCHSTLRPFAFKTVNKRSKQDSVWFQDPPKFRQRKGKLFPEYTMSDFTTLCTSNTKLIFLSISPTEQGWFKTILPWSVYRFIGYFIMLLIRILLRIIFPWRNSIESLIQLLVRFPNRYIKHVRRKKWNYFEELKDEYNYIAHTSTWKEKDCSFKLIHAGTQIDDNSDSIQVILTIEGAHSFISGNAENVKNKKFNINDVLDNIDYVKNKNNWTYPPFFVALSHHFYNGLSGHAKSIYQSTRLGQWFSRLLSQDEGKDTQINVNGWKVINRLLCTDGDINNTRRILIDVKHMSVTARKEYYCFVQLNNLNTEKIKIPIIFSHGGYSGCKTMNELIDQKDTDEKYNNSYSEFNICSINLADDEIKIINDSEGLIGLNLDQRILSGRKVVDKAPKPRKNNLSKVYEYWGKQVFKNIIGILKAVIDDPNATDTQKKHIWNCICIGSDFDGMINPVDGCISAQDYKKLKVQLIKLFNEWHKTDGKKYGIIITPDKIVEKIFFTNAYEFAKMNFKE